MCSGSEAGSYLRLIDYVYHSTLGLRVLNKKKKGGGETPWATRSKTGANCTQNPHLRRKVDVRLPGKGNSNSHGARPVHLIITMIKWIRTSRLSIKNSTPWATRSKTGANCTQNPHLRERNQPGSEGFVA